MRAAERQLKIQELMRGQEFIDAASVASKLAASESSIRRDLIDLEEKGLLRRVRGGAVSFQAQGEPRNMAWLVNRAQEEKQRIGRAAAALVEDGQTLIMDGGSTVAEVARRLLGRPLQVITNSVPIAQIFYDSPGVEVTLTGGHLYPRLGVLLGPYSEEILCRVDADLLIMGTGGITEAGLSNTSALVVGAERKMIEASRRVIVVADHSKFGRQALAPLSPLDAVDVIVTDRELAPNFKELLEKHGIELILA
ncbi:MAG: DeoR/GlpR transcriptional regulator [Acidobacteria bacterium]|nr:DeoR/GlpR transcriptional regulator [Acidobacteriota bacterium]